MKLNPNCIRETLLYLEDTCKIIVTEDDLIEIDFISISQIYDALPNYSKEDIFYSIFNLEQAGYIEAAYIGADNCISGYVVSNITYEGHEFLAGIRDDKCWSAIKKIGGAIRNYSLEAISSISKGITSALVSTALDKISPELISSFLG